MSLKASSFSISLELEITYSYSPLLGALQFLAVKRSCDFRSGCCYRTRGIWRKLKPCVASFTLPFFLRKRDTAYRLRYPQSLKPSSGPTPTLSSLARLTHYIILSPQGFAPQQAIQTRSVTKMHSLMNNTLSAHMRMQPDSQVPRTAKAPCGKCGLQHSGPNMCCTVCVDCLMRRSTLMTLSLTKVL